VEKNRGTIITLKKGWDKEVIKQKIEKGRIRKSIRGGRKGLKTGAV